MADGIQAIFDRARTELEKSSFHLPPVVDAQAAQKLVALCDALEARIREMERLANPLNQPHSGRFVFVQRVMRRLMAPTLKIQTNYNQDTITALRTEAELLLSIVASLYSAKAESTDVKH